jgi:transposase-like protein
MSRARKKKAEMNSLGVLSSVRLAAAERSEGERSELQRSGAAAKAVAGSGSISAPDSEVVAKAKRRTFTAEYKQRILREAETAAALPGGVGALLRREGLYSSLLAYWRRERADGIREALAPRKRGPKSKRNPMDEEVQKLRRQAGAGRNHPNRGPGDECGGAGSYEVDIPLPPTSNQRQVSLELCAP